MRLARQARLLERCGGKRDGRAWDGLLEVPRRPQAQSVRADLVPATRRAARERGESYSTQSTRPAVLVLSESGWGKVPQCSRAAPTLD